MSEALLLKGLQPLRRHSSITFFWKKM